VFKLKEPITAPLLSNAVIDPKRVPTSVSNARIEKVLIVFANVISSVNGVENALVNAGMVVQTRPFVYKNARRKGMTTTEIGGF
jgi:hypothetical protein